VEVRGGSRAKENSSIRGFGSIECQKILSMVLFARGGIGRAQTRVHHLQRCDATILSMHRQACSVSRGCIWADASI
jgi:hypothetical protein